MNYSKEEYIEYFSENKNFSTFSQKKEIINQNFVKIKASGHDLEINEKFKFVRLSNLSLNFLFFFFHFIYTIKF